MFASARQAIVEASDPDYSTWVEGGGIATPWPRDAAGNQTNEALQAVIAPYGMFVDLVSYTAAKRYETEQGGIMLSSGMPIRTDDRSQAKISGVMLAAKYPPVPVKAPPGGSGPAFTTKWHAVDGNVYPLDTPAIVAMSGELQLHIDQCFEAASAVLAGIADGTITTREQVDQAFATMPTLNLSSHVGR